MWSCNIGLLLDLMYTSIEEMVAKFFKNRWTFLESIKVKTMYLSNKHQTVAHTFILSPNQLYIQFKAVKVIGIVKPGLALWVLDFPPLSIAHINTEKHGIKNAAWGIPHKTYNAIKWAISTGNKMGMLSRIWIKPSKNRVRQPFIVLQALQKNPQGQQYQIQLTGQGQSAKKDNCSLQWKAGHSKFWLM